MEQDNKQKKPLLIAVCGKGGVGKTSISALVIKLLAEKADKRILAIDADPAVGLATALGFTGVRAHRQRHPQRPDRAH